MPEKRIRIVVDQSPENPRQWDNLGTMACWNDRHHLGDEQIEDATEWMSNLIQSLTNCGDPSLIADEHRRAILEKHVAILPLFLYDHSGITMNTTGFSSGWDSGQVGWIYCTLEQARDNWMMPDAGWEDQVRWHDDRHITLREAAHLVMRGEVEEYDMYIRGDVYGFILEQRNGCEHCGHVEWEELDSCWGFYGSDVSKNGILEHLDDDMRESAKAASIEYAA